MMPAVKAELEAKGLRTFDYGNAETRDGKRAWYSVAPDARWSKELNCTPGDYACPGGEGKESTIRMTAADAVYAAQWQQSKGCKLDMLFNAGAGE